MMDFNERVIPNESANFLLKEAEARYEFARKRIGKNKRILDFGCGTGYGSAILSKGNEVLGIDRDREAISYAKKHYGRQGEFLVGDVEKFTTGEKFDVVCSFEVIEHLKNPDKYLKNIDTLLTANGTAFFSTPNTTIFSPNGNPKSEYHTKEYTLDEFEKILKKHFLTVELYGQRKSKKAQNAFGMFLRSQTARQGMVNLDILRIRKLFPKKYKEFIWKYIGSIFGRKDQEILTVSDFPITKNSLAISEYFVAVCKK